MKSLVENRGRWDAGFRSPLLRLLFFCFFNEVFTTIPSIAVYFHHPYGPQPSSTGAECEGEKEEEGPCEGLSGPAGQ